MADSHSSDIRDLNYVLVFLRVKNILNSKRNATRVIGENLLKSYINEDIVGHLEKVDWRGLEPPMATSPA